MYGEMTFDRKYCVASCSGSEIRENYDILKVRLKEPPGLGFLNKFAKAY